MKRIAVIIVMALGLTGTVLAGPAGARTTMPQNPAPVCNPWSQIYYMGPPQCYCPPGWDVVYPSFWAFTFDNAPTRCERPAWY
jgi:hypothetical protein